MSSSDLCSMVNILAKGYCELKNNNSSCDKNQLIFQTDFYINKRLILFSLVNYEYKTYSNIIISRDELAILRDFLLTYLSKFTSNTINDVYIHYTSGCLIYSFVSYERSAIISDSSLKIKEIQNDIAINYENNIFKIIELYLSNLSNNSQINKIQNLYKFFKIGKNYSKYNINSLMNYNSLEKYCLSISKILNDQPENSEQWQCEPYEPYEPNEPYYPTNEQEIIKPPKKLDIKYINNTNKNDNISISKNLKNNTIENKLKALLEATEINEPNEPSQPHEPSELYKPFDYVLLSKKMVNNTKDINENDIRLAISKILEITTSQEASFIPD